jgi:ubiquinone/menaquinone biosynthesis C-methylase UbiE
MAIPSGRALLDPAKILKEAGLTAGQVYADFGCGTLGHFVLPASEVVGPEGRVFALDILQSALVSVRERARAARILNLETVWGDLKHKQGTRGIADASVDLVSFVNLTGLLLKDAMVIANTRRVLKTGGRLLLVDWRPEIEMSKFMTAYTTDSELLKTALEKNGFNLIKFFSAGPNHFGLLFQKT